MLTTIQLNYKLCVQAREIRDVSIDRNLAAKSETAQLPAPQVPPQQSLRICRLIPQSTGTNL
jgi:hypothetical protein